MRRITSCFSLSRQLLFSFFILCSFYMSGNAFSRQNWNGDYTTVTYNPDENYIKFRFEVFDYFFGPGRENGYLRWCDFFYTTDGETYIHLMRAETEDQGYLAKNSWTWLKMRYKKLGARIQFIGCFYPTNGVMWPDHGQDIEVDVSSEQKAFFTAKWFLGENYKDVKRIRLNGFWQVNGVYKGDEIINVYYDIPSREMLKSNTLKDIPSALSNTIKVIKQADEIVVTGALVGESIKVYNVSGIEVKSIVTQSDVAKIKLAENQIYVVKVGQACYKVAL